jgi:RimJ/RimL family protein N-acetyltransferase
MSAGMGPFRTPRLTLRRWAQADREPFAKLNADPEVMEFMPGILEPARSDALVSAIDEHFEKHRFGLWAVEVNAGPSFIGCVGLQRPSFVAPFTPCVEIGWRLARDAWGRGYATEAAREVCRVAFAELQLSALVSYTATANTRSRGVMERLGMIHARQEDFDHPRLPEGHPLRRHVLYRLSRDEWLRAGASI